MLYRIVDVYFLIVHACFLRRRPDVRVLHHGKFLYPFWTFSSSAEELILLEILLQGGACHLPKFFISFNVILCGIVSALSILPRIQERMPRSGLLQSSFITLYAVYITWSALINNPGSYSTFSLLSSIEFPKLAMYLMQFLISDKECNPSLINIFTNRTTPQGQVNYNLGRSFQRHMCLQPFQSHVISCATLETILWFKLCYSIL